MPRAVYVALVARAAPGLYSAEQIEWELPLAQGHALIHAGSVLDGTVMVWPDPMLSARGSWWGKVCRWLKTRSERRTSA